MSVDYLLHESSLGYAIFKVAMQPDTVGNRLKEIQQKAGDLAHFGKPRLMQCMLAVELTPDCRQNG